MATFNILRISDGTDTIDLLDPSPGIHLDDWNPAIQQPKGGGVFQDSPLAPGRRRIYSQPSNVRDNFSFKVNGLTRNEVAQRVNDLVALLEKAMEYWETDWQNIVVYLIMQIEGGNIQYAAIKDYTFLELDNPFAQPFYGYGSPTLDNLNLEIEHGGWLGEIPGNGSAINLIMAELNGITYEANNIFVANKWVAEGITHIYISDGGVFGANQVNSTAFNLLPAVPAVNDAVYFGNNTSIPFSNLIFDLNGNGTDYTAQWEVWGGAAWVTIAATEIDDNTSSLQGSGVLSLVWNPADQTWATTSVNGVTAYWIRLRVTAIGASPIGPAQQNRPVFYQHYPYIEVPSDEVLGTIETLFRNWLYYRGPYLPVFLTNFIIGLRQTSRGDDFSAFLNWSDNTLPTGISISTGNVYANLLNAPDGRALYDSSVSGIGATHGWIYIDKSVAHQYIGRFRLYMIAQITNAAATVDLRISLNLEIGNVEIFVTDYQSITGSTNPTLVDFGNVIIPSISSDGAIIGTDYEFELEAKATGSTGLYAITMILMPVDELGINTEFVSFGSGGSGGVGQPSGFESFLELSSLNPKVPRSAWARNEANNNKYLNPPILTVNNSMTLKSNSEQRIWILSLSDGSLGSGYGVATGDCQHLLEANINTNPMYLGLRGNE